MEPVRSEETKRRIREAMAATRSRRLLQTCRVFELKVSRRHNPKEVFESMSQYFREAKWVVNDMVALARSGGADGFFGYKYLEHKSVVHYDRDGNAVTDALSLPSVMHRSLVNQKKTDVKNLSKSKKKGRKVGQLKFKSSVHCLPIITGYAKIISGNRITIPGFRKLHVHGLNQLDKFETFEIADARLVRRASGFFVMLTVMLPKETRKPTRRSVGVDFGIKTTITTSDNETYDCKVRETESLKYLSRMYNRHKRTKDSRRRWNCRRQLAREYGHVANARKDICNKIYHDLVSKYDVIYFQDEQVSNWHHGWFGRQVQQSCMGALKARLKSLVPSGRAYMLDKWVPTTKMCPKCGILNAVGLEERTYTCGCGYSKPRDWHSACNILTFGSTKRAECMEHASAEETVSTAVELGSTAASGLLRSENKKPPALQGGA